MGGTLNILSSSIFFFGLGKKSQKKKSKPQILFRYNAVYPVLYPVLLSWHLFCVFMASVLLRPCIFVASALWTTRTFFEWGIYTEQDRTEQNGIERNRTEQKTPPPLPSILFDSIPFYFFQFRWIFAEQDRMEQNEIERDCISFLSGQKKQNRIELDRVPPTSYQ